MGDATFWSVIDKLDWDQEGDDEAVVEPVIFRLPRSTWQRRDIAGRQANWASRREFNVAFWARDGVVIHVAGEVTAVKRAVERLACSGWGGLRPARRSPRERANAIRRVMRVSCTVRPRSVRGPAAVMPGLVEFALRSFLCRI